MSFSVTDRRVQTVAWQMLPANPLAHGHTYIQDDNPQAGTLRSTRETCSKARKASSEPQREERQFLQLINTSPILTRRPYPLILSVA